MAPCGTLAAYRRHLRLGEPTCPACRRANRDVKRGQSDRLHRARYAAVVDDPERATDWTPTGPPETPSARGDLLFARDALVAAVGRVRVVDPARLAPLVRELRETLRALAALP